MANVVSENGAEVTEICDVRAEIRDMSGGPASLQQPDEAVFACSVASGDYRKALVVDSTEDYDVVETTRSKSVILEGDRRRQQGHLEREDTLPHGQNPDSFEPVRSYLQAAVIPGVDATSCPGVAIYATWRDVKQALAGVVRNENLERTIEAARGAVTEHSAFISQGLIADEALLRYRVRLPKEGRLADLAAIFIHLPSDAPST